MCNCKQILVQINPLLKSFLQVMAVFHMAVFVQSQYRWTCPDAGEPGARKETAASVNYGCRAAGAGLVMWKSMVVM